MDRDNSLEGQSVRRTRLFIAAAACIAVGATALLFIVGNLLASLWIYSAADYDVVARAVRARSNIYDHGLRSNASADLLWGRRAYGFYTNSMGFRDGAPRQIDLNPKSRQRRILFIGDSFTEGLGLPFEETFVGQFAHANRQLEVFNAAMSSYSPSLYYLKLRALLEAGFRFDELWVFIDLSDLQDEATGYSCDHPRQAEYLDCRDKAAVPRPPVGYFTDLKAAPGAFELARHVLFRRLSDGRTIDFFPLFKVLRHGQGEDPEIPFEQLVRNVRGGWTINPLGEAFLPLGIEAGRQKEWDRMEQLHRLMSEHGIQLNVAVYPWHTQMYFLPKPYDEHVRIWSEFCRERCARFLNLYEDFFRYRDTVAPKTWYRDLFIAGDDHFNAAGNHLIAKRLIDTYQSGQR